MPALLVKLRRIHIESQSKRAVHPVDQAGDLVVTREVTSVGFAIHTVVDMPQCQSLDGVNAQQRTPLEAQFHVYVGRK